MEKIGWRRLGIILIIFTILWLVSTAITFGRQEDEKEYYKTMMTTFCNLNQPIVEDVSPEDAAYFYPCEKWYIENLDKYPHDNGEID